MQQQPERSGRYRTRTFRWAMAAVLISLVGSTFAANIVINGNNRVEFGQGIYRITSCDQFIGIHLEPSNAFSDGLSRVQYIRLSGLDVARCAGSSLRIRLYDSSTATALELFTNPAYRSRRVDYPCCTETGTAVVMVIAAGAQQSTAAQNVTLISATGKSIGTGDPSQTLVYEASNGTFTITFAQPLALMSAVSRHTFESASNV
jgi:hypothetical protein